MIRKLHHPGCIIFKSVIAYSISSLKNHPALINSTHEHMCYIKKGFVYFLKPSSKMKRANNAYMRHLENIVFCLQVIFPYVLHKI